jgi:hypothetical protein
MSTIQSNGAKPTARKPHRDWGGYVSERRNPITGDHNVVVLSEGQGIDPGDGRYACICNAHRTIVQGTLSQMRGAMRDSCLFCDGCREAALESNSVLDGSTRPQQGTGGVNHGGAT